MPDAAVPSAVPSAAAQFAAGSSRADLLASMPYAAALGISLDEVTPQLVRGSLAWSPERCTASGVMHGGAATSPAHTLRAGCAPLHQPPGAGNATVETPTDLFRCGPERKPVPAVHPLPPGRS